MAFFDDKVLRSSYDDFLGVNDTDIFGKAEPTGEDRIFSTAQTVNVLLASFTYFNNSTGKLNWIMDGETINTINLVLRNNQYNF